MKNHMFIPNSLQLKLIEKDKNKHQKRLEEIQTQNRKAKVLERDISSTLKISQTRQNNIKVTHKGKVNGLEQENELLLGKLVEISRKKSPNFMVRSESANGKSLHAPYKKKEMDRILSENEAFAKRLISQQSTFNRKKLDQDFRKHKELVGNLKRISSSPGKSFKKLPPLKSELQSPKVLSLKQSELKQSVVKDTKEAEKEQPQQETTNTPAVAINNTKSEVVEKATEDITVSVMKENNQASEPQKSQEVTEKANQNTQPEKVEPLQVKEENTNHETSQKEIN